MKKILFTLILTTSACIKLSSQTVQVIDTTRNLSELIDSVWHNVDLNQLSTSFFKHKNIYFTNPDLYHGTYVDSTNRTQSYKFETLFKQFNNFDDGSSALPKWDSLDFSNYTNQIPLLILNTSFNQLKAGAADSGYIYFEDGVFYDTLPNSNPFEEKSCYAASFNTTRIDTNSFNIIIPSEFVFEFGAQTISSISIDFKDELGYRNVTLGQAYTVTYDPGFTGWKDIDIVLNMSDGSAKYIGTNLHIIGRYDSDIPGNEPIPAGEIWENFTAENAFQGTKGSAKVTVAYGCGHTKLTKPFIVFGGIDPPQLPQIGDALKNFGTISIPQDFGNDDYDSFRLWLFDNARDLYEDLEKEGYDIVYVDYTHGADFIQRNGELARSVIKEVNRIKALNGSTEENVILGISMGGVVARWALTTMENASETHDVSKFISFDSPHNGAYTPVAFQMLLNHIAEFSTTNNKKIKNEVAFIKLFVDVFENPASRQLLIRNIFHSNGNPDKFFNASSNPDHNALISELDNLGYPQNCKNFALINGSSNAVPQKNATANMAMVTALGTQGTLIPIIVGHENVGFVQLGSVFTSLSTIIQLRTLPNTSQGLRQVYNGTLILDVNGFIVKFPSKEIVSMTDFVSLEIVPGGNIDLNDFKSTGSGGINLSIPDAQVCFTPSVSTSGLKPAFRNNFFYNLDNNFNSTNNTWNNNESKINDFQSQTPSPTIAPTNFNDFHTRFTDANENFLLSSRVQIIPSLKLDQGLAIGQTFNFGKNNSTYTSNKVYSPSFLTVQNNAVLAINDNIPLGYSPSAQQNPTAGSTFKVNTGSANCSPINIFVESGGIVEIGDNAAGNIGILEISSETILEVKSGGTLRIADNSKLIIEEGSVFRVNPNANIILEGENAVIEIRGSVQLMNNAVFSFTGGTAAKAGYLDIYTDKNAGSPFFGAGSPGLNLVGNNKITDLLFKLDGIWTVPSNFSNFELTQGSAEFKPNGHLKLYSPVDIDLCQLKGDNQAPYSSKGIVTYGQNNVSVKATTFIYFKDGFIALNNTNGNSPSLEKVHFAQCERGMYYESVTGSIIDDCSFYSSVTGLQVELLENLEIKNCEFKLNTIFGLEMLNSYAVPIKHLFLEENTFDNNTIGFDNTNSTIEPNVTLKCNKFLDNTKGIVTRGNINLTPTLHFNNMAGGDNSFYNNNTAIRLDDYCKIYLDNGSNNFINNIGNTPYNFITGYVDYSVINPANNSLAAGGNYWDPSTANLSTAGSNYYTLQTYPGYGLHPVPVILTGSTLSSTNLACFTPPGSGSGSGGGGGPIGFVLSKDEVDNETYNIYPNPTNKDVNVLLKNSAKGLVQISIYDINGKLIKNESKKSTGSKLYFNLKLDEYTAGIYIIKIKTANSEYVQRITKK